MVLFGRLVAKQREVERVVRLVGRKWLRESTVDRVVKSNIVNIGCEAASASAEEK